MTEFIVDPNYLSSLARASQDMGRVRDLARRERQQIDALGLPKPQPEIAAIQDRARAWEHKTEALNELIQADVTQIQEIIAWVNKDGVADSRFSSTDPRINGLMGGSSALSQYVERHRNDIDFFTSPSGRAMLPDAYAALVEEMSAVFWGSSWDELDRVFRDQQIWASAPIVESASLVPKAANALLSSGERRAVLLSTARSFTGPEITRALLRAALVQADSARGRTLTNWILYELDENKYELYPDQPAHRAIAQTAIGEGFFTHRNAIMAKLGDGIITPEGLETPRAVDEYLAGGLSKIYHTRLGASPISGDQFADDGAGWVNNAFAQWATERIRRQDMPMINVGQRIGIWKKVVEQAHTAGSHLTGVELDFGARMNAAILSTSHDLEGLAIGTGGKVGGPITAALTPIAFNAMEAYATGPQPDFDQGTITEIGERQNDANNQFRRLIDPLYVLARVTDLEQQAATNPGSQIKPEILNTGLLDMDQCIDGTCKDFRDGVTRGVTENVS